MRKLFSVLSLVVLFSIVSFGQAQVTIPITATDGIGANNGLAVGLDLTATNGVDPSLGESDLPPFPPSGVFEARFDLTPYAGSALSSYWDFRNAPAFPFTGVVEHTMIWQLSTGATSFTIGYDVPPEATMTIQDALGGIIFNSGPLTGVGNYVITAPLTTAIITMDYTNIGPSGPAPEFAIAPTSLNFGGVAVGSPATLQATVSNPGTDPLTISNIVSSDPQFTFAPNTFPITVNPGAGNEVVFDVTFTPAVLGPATGNITFTSDAPSSPDVLPVQGVGADAGPTFGVTPTSLTFPTVFVGNSANQNLTVTNNGLTNTLNISSVVATNAVDYSVTPTSATIAPGANQVFTVTFAPSGDGTLTSDIVFTHDGTSSPDAVPASGFGQTPASVFGLVFEEDTTFVPENTAGLTQTMQLLGTLGGSDLHALQFRLLSNMYAGDDVILTYQSIAKGADVDFPNWILETNVVRGPINANGASEDTIYVLLYNITETGDLPMGVDYNDLLTVTYKTAVLPPTVPTQLSTFQIFNAEGSTFGGNLIDVTPSDPILQVVVEAAGGTYGDVNGDGCVDILDLIMVVDHIVGRDSLTGAEFDRADLAPWIPGEAEPTPDGVVNVQDLSVIQSIILTGFYPSGEPVKPCGYLSKVDGPTDATVTLYINAEGISAYIDSDIGIRGAQIEFGSVSNNPENMIINTPLGQGYYQLSEGLFRTLMYDRAGQKYISAGNNNFMADMPFVLTNPEDVSVAKIVLVDTDTKKLANIVVQTIYGTTYLPLDYILFQNYPNPFNPTTAIQFQVPKTSDVKIAVYDMLGQEVRTLVAGEVMRGTYTVDWDGFNNDGAKVSSGTYIYRMTAGEFIQSKKMVLIK